MRTDSGTVFSPMKVMVPDDLMRVQITKISVYFFYPLYFFGSHFTRPDPKGSNLIFEFK